MTNTPPAFPTNSHFIGLSTLPTEQQQATRRPAAHAHHHFCVSIHHHGHLVETPFFWWLRRPSGRPGCGRSKGTDTQRQYGRDTDVTM